MNQQGLNHGSEHAGRYATIKAETGRGHQTGVRADGPVQQVEPITSQKWRAHTEPDDESEAERPQVL